MEIFTKNAEESFELGQKLGASLKGSEVICLKGEMGAGKTTFVQGIAKGLHIKKNLTSPTFILMRSYVVSNRTKIKKLYHVDLYRLDENIEEELSTLGVYDLWGKSDTVFVVEWGEKIKSYPSSLINIKIEVVSETIRKFTYEISN